MRMILLLLLVLALAALGGNHVTKKSASMQSQANTNNYQFPSILIF